MKAKFFFLVVTCIVVACQSDTLKKEIGIKQSNIAKKNYTIHKEPSRILPRRFLPDTHQDITYLGVDQGLPASQTNAILRDSKGFIWVATVSRGVCRFDGHSFEVFTTSDGLANNIVYSIWEDQKGKIWFGTWNGLSCFDGNTFRTYTKDDGIVGNLILTIYEDAQGYMWFGTTSGVSRFDGKSFTNFTEKDGLLNTSVRGICADDNGNIWFGTTMGLWRFDGKSFENFTKQDGLLDNFVRSLEIDSRGNLWIATNQGVNSFDGRKFLSFTVKDGLAHNKVETVWIDSRHRLWFGTQGGVSCFDGIKFKNITINNGLTHNYVRGICQDEYQDYWFATYGGGLCRYRDESFEMFSLKEMIGKEKDIIWTIEEDSKGTMWLGTNTNGMISYANNTFKNFTSKDGLNSDNVNVIKVDSLGHLWIGTDNGINIYDGKMFKSFTKDNGLIHNYVTNIFEDSQNKKWIATTKGISCYNGKVFKNFNKKNGLASDFISSICEDYQGKYWVGTFKGLNSYDGQTIKKNFFNSSTLKGNITFVFEDSKQQLWIGTTHGIALYDTTSLKFYTENGGLLNDVLRTVTEDHNGNIWLGTSKGIVLLQQVPREAKTDKEELVFQKYRPFTFGKLDGLKELNIAQNAQKLNLSKKMWWGVDGGVTMLDLNKFKLPAKPPRTPQLTYIKVQEQYIDFRQLQKDTTYSASLKFGEALKKSYTKVTDWFNYPEQMVLPHDIKHLTFHFSAIDWAAPHKLKFRYRVIGLDKRWSAVTSDNFADYRNIPYGQYTLEVQATGVAQKWSKVFRYSFEILPPWWHTWWARTGYVAVALLLVWSLLRWRTARLRKNQRILETKVKQKTEEIAAQNEEIVIQRDRLDESFRKLQQLDAFKEQTVNMIAHDLKTPLNNIMGLSEGATDDPKQQRIYQSSRQMLHMIINMLDTQKLEEARLQLNTAAHQAETLASQAVEQVFWLAHSRNIRLMKKTTAIQVEADADLIVRVLVNLLNNAIKYSSNNSNVLVQAERIDEQLAKFSVTDTGTGITEEAQSKIFDKFYQVSAKKQGQHSRSTGIGLTFCKLAIELHQGQIGVNSSVNLGSTFWFTLPLAKEALNENMLSDTVDSIPTPVVSHEPSAKIQLSFEDKTTLEPWLAELRKYEVYQLTKVKAILQEMNFEKDTTLFLWKQALEQALYSSNEAQYNQLIQL